MTTLYDAALADLPGLEPVGRQMLLAHLERREQALGESVAPAVARLAGALLAVRGGRHVSVMTAVAQAELITRHDVGAVILRLQEDLLALARIDEKSAMTGGTPIEAVKTLLGHLRTEAEALSTRLDRNERTQA